MDNRNLTVEQLQAIERWENEGGKITPALRFMASSQPGEMRNEKSARQEVIVPRKNRSWEQMDVWPGWRLV